MKEKVSTLESFTFMYAQKKKRDYCVIHVLNEITRIVLLKFKIIRSLRGFFLHYIIRARKRMKNWGEKASERFMYLLSAYIRFLTISNYIVTSICSANLAACELLNFV